MVCRAPPASTSLTVEERAIWRRSSARRRSRTIWRSRSCLRSSRLHAAQPDGDPRRIPACSTSRTPCTGRSPTTSSSLFRDAFVSWPEERILDWTIRYWEKGDARGSAGHRRFRRVLARLRMDGPAAPFESPRHLCAHSPSRRQGRLCRGHAALHRLRPPRGRTLSRIGAPRCALLDRARGGTPTAAQYSDGRPQ